MNAPFFTDKHRPPTEETIREALGKAGPCWSKLFEAIGTEHPDLAKTWRYYLDGKSWLLKVSRGSKTVFWGAVERGAFRVTFYFPIRLIDALLESALSEERKAEIRRHAPVGKLQPVSVVFGPGRHLRDVLHLIVLKKRLK